MAGQSQAANLGGMLSQIGNTLGTSVDSENYVRGTQNMFRPDVEADDIEGQRRLMNWQTKLGRTDEARNTMLGINTLEEKQKEKKEQDGIVRVGQLQTGMQNVVNTLDRTDLTEDNRKTLEATLDQLQSKLTIEGGAIGKDLSSVGQGLLDERDARIITQEGRERANAAEEERLRQVAEAAEVREDEDKLRKLPNAAARENFLKNGARHPSKMTGYINELNIFDEQARTRREAETDRTTALKPVDLSGYAGLTEADKESLSILQDKVTDLTEMYYKNGTWADGGKRKVLDAQETLSNEAFEASQRNTREAQDREQEYRDVLTSTLLKNMPSTEDILKYAEDNKLDPNTAAEKLQQAANIAAAQQVTMIAQQKDPASNLEKAKRPLKLDKGGKPVLDGEGNEVRMSDRELEGVRAKIVEKLYASGQIKTMPSWDKVLEIYKTITDNKDESKPETKETTQYGDRYQFSNKNSKVGDYLSQMIGEFGTVTGPVSAPRTAEGVTGDINFTGVETLGGTPRPDLRTPEQIESNKRLLGQ